MARNGGAFDENTGRKVTKATGRVQAYGLFLNEYGFLRFKHLHGVRFDKRNPDHDPMMHIIYQSLSEKDRQNYKRRAKIMNEDKEAVTARRHQGELKRRGYAHDNADEMYQLKKETNQGTRELQERKRRANGPVFLPKLKNNLEPKLLIESDFKILRDRRRNELKEIFSFVDRNISYRTHSFIGILNYANIVISETLSVVAFPAEIVIVKYSLEKGVFSQHREKFRFNIRELISDPSLSTEEIDNSLENQANKYSEMYMIEPKRGNSIQDVVPWLLEHLNQTELNVLDAEQFVIQMETLTFIVNRLGTLEEIAEFEKLKFHCIQDVGHAIREINGSNVNMSGEDTEQYFSRNMLIKDPTYYCREHHRYADRVKRYYQELQMCPMHQALSKIQLFFEFCADFNVCGFSHRHITEQHSLCCPHNEVVPLFVKSISLPVEIYLANQKPNLPAPVVDEKDKRLDDNIHTHTAMRMMEAIHITDAPGLSRTPPMRVTPPPSPPQPNWTAPSPNWRSPSVFSQQSTRPVSVASSVADPCYFANQRPPVEQPRFEQKRARNMSGWRMEFFETSDKEWMTYKNLNQRV